MLFEGSDDRLYRWVTWAFILGSLAHLWLADAWHPDWFWGNAVYVVGLLVLATTRSAAGWLLCASGALFPLLFARDQLTQSVVLLAFSVAGAIAMVLHARNRQGVSSFLAAFRWVTVATYGLATFHKLNRDFINPDTSCANYGIAKLLDYYRIDFTPPDEIAPFIPFVALLIEGSIFVAYLARRHRLAWLLIPIFHIPITVTMAPAFALVMLPGHLAFATREDFEALQETLEKRWRTLLGMTVVATTVSLLAHGALPEITMIPKEALLWLILWSILAAFVVDRRTLFARRPNTPPRPAWPAWIITGAFVLNGITPYLGVQYQHAAAMLSNLRIDTGCWNSLLVPESVRLTDDYIRIDHAYLREPGFIEEYENILKDQLWNPVQMRQMRRNWCKPKLRPIYIEAQFRHETYVIQDLCDDQELPFHGDGILGIELFKNSLRFQKNLMRECPQACIH